MAGGYDADKFTVLPNFVDAAKVAYPSTEKDDYYIYVGRLAKMKGILTLCEAASQLPHRLIVVGGGDLLDELKNQYGSYGNIEFRGQMTWDEFRPLLEHARFSVIPSECSENNPLSVLESLCLGTPVLGSHIGGIPELIEPGANGFTFTPGDTDQLRHSIAHMFATTFNPHKIAADATARYSSDAYYEALMRIYQS